MFVTADKLVDKLTALWVVDASINVLVIPDYEVYACLMNSLRQIGDEELEQPVFIPTCWIENRDGTIS